MVKPAVKILLVEDDRVIRRFVRMSLEHEGMRVLEADSGVPGISMTTATSAMPDLMIVDLGLPDIDGLEVIHQVRCRSTMPIIVLSGRLHDEEKIAALDAGADDYVTKPFSMPELLARVRAQLRRHHRQAPAGALQIRFGRISIDLEARLVVRDGETVHLTPVEYRLLTVLAHNAGRVITHRQLLHDVWGPGHAENFHYLRIYMAHLRLKLEQDPAQPKYIVTETGVGYRLAGVDFGSGPGEAVKEPS
ncbi:response regulator [Trinickia fusca]|uniref:Response regulator n=1 Tax=Trinickia fusca TaxID=2419777 RepID=A0A494X1H6_9BURK|nr:response regulator [Trinickia fusca]RKP44578.1 response regulator [Trinickia fusca]